MRFVLSAPVVGVVWMSVTLDSAFAFTQPNTLGGSFLFYSRPTPLASKNEDDADADDLRPDVNGGPDADADAAASFYRELQQAKKKALGGLIPPEQAKEAAASSESEFLQAMKKSKKEFEAAKESLGSDGAVDLFMGRIKKEDEAKASFSDLEAMNEKSNQIQSDGVAIQSSDEDASFQ